MTNVHTKLQEIVTRLSLFCFKKECISSREQGFFFMLILVPEET